MDDSFGKIPMTLERRCLVVLFEPHLAISVDPKGSFLLGANKGNVARMWMESY